MAQAKVEIIEVGPRDGLQNEPNFVATADKIALIERAISYGARRIEIASFVHPKLVPQMADAEAVAHAVHAPHGVETIGLVLNMRGAERALTTPVHQLGAVAVASDSFGQRNQGQTSAQSVAIAKEIIATAQQAGRTAQVTIAVAFGCPFQGAIDPLIITDMVASLMAAGPVEIALADTIGVATPNMVHDMVTRLRPMMGDTPLRLHFHNTRNMAVANAWAGYLAGVRRFDAALGGIGGCPFAPKATGNVATEDLAFLFDGAHVATGLSHDALLTASDWLSGVMGRKLPSMVAQAGWPSAMGAMA